MCTLKLPPDASDVGPHDSTWPGGAAGAIEHRPALDWVSIDQVTPDPDPAGSGSFTVTPLAVPAPELFTVTVNPMLSPAFTVFASAFFTMWMLAGLHVMTSPEWSDPSLVVVTVAVLL